MAEIEKVKGESAGIKIERTEGEIRPPLATMAGEEAKPEEEIKAKSIPLGKIPISPAIIKPPLRLEGMMLSEVTGYPGWMYTEEDLEEYAELIAQLGLEMSPVFQVLIGLLTLHGAKFMAMTVWKKSGRPGDLKKKRETGEVKSEQRKGEEVLQ